MLLAALGIIGSIASLLGVYALVDARRNRRIKLLAFETTGPVPLATAADREREYSLSIHYRAADSTTEEVIDAAFVRYLRFANFGKEPIRRDDIAPANPLRVEVTGARVLDIGLSAKGRAVTRVELDSPSVSDSAASARISFDYLDHNDGAVVRVLTTSPRATMILTGDIIGMPSGIRRENATPARSLWGKIGFGLWVAAEIAALATAGWIVQYVTGSWKDVWLVALSIGAFLGPILTVPIAALLALEDKWPLRGGRFPEELALPRWLGRSRYFLDPDEDDDLSAQVLPAIYVPPTAIAKDDGDGPHR